MARQTVTKKTRIRIGVCLGLVLLALVLLSLRLGYHMIIKGEEYKAMAIKQQTSDSIVTAKRGGIVDRNLNDLAISSTTNTVWIRPEVIRNQGKDEDDSKAKALLEIRNLATILNMTEEEVESVVNSESKLIKLKKYVDDDAVITALREAKLPGVEIIESAKRYYPNGAFLSQVLGSTSDDNIGINGLELYYNSMLSGLDGRRITNKDNKRNALAYGVDKYYAEENGKTLWTTIDQNIQMIVTQELEAAVKKTRAQRAMCLLLDPKTGDVLAMAQTEDYDPNYPREPLEKDREKFDEMTDEEKVYYWNQLWRNFCISDVYEPGSTFKLITTSIALELGVTNMNDQFYCAPVTVADYTLHCWYYPQSHGYENLYEAVENSCNPAMVALSQRIGMDRYYAGLNNFGLTEKTGIDFSGEGGNIIPGRNSVGLATMSYGQGIAVTPISLVSAIGSIANEGYLMKPRLVKGILDDEGNVIEEFEPEIKSRTISEQTADEVLGIMERVVTEGGGKSAGVRGYRIGGKTGTANKPIAGGYSDTDVFASFLGVAPIDDPKVVILVIVDTPKGVLYGSSTAAPCAHNILEQILPILGVQPKYTDADYKAMNKDKVTVPDLTGKTGESAAGIVSSMGLDPVFSPALSSNAELIVVDQFPKPGATAVTGSHVTLYYELAHTNPNEEVPIQ